MKPVWGVSARRSLQPVFPYRLQAVQQQVWGPETAVRGRGETQQEAAATAAGSRKRASVHGWRKTEWKKKTKERSTAAAAALAGGKQQTMSALCRLSQCLSSQTSAAWLLFPAVAGRRVCCMREALSPSAAAKQQRCAAAATQQQCVETQQRHALQLRGMDKRRSRSSERDKQIHATGAGNRQQQMQQHSGFTRKKK